MIDVLGHPITAGCTVLTAPHWAQRMSKVVKVERVTKTSVILIMPCTETYIDPATRTCTSKTKVRELRRHPYQVLVIDKQLKHNSKMYPEYML